VQLTKAPPTAEAAAGLDRFLAVGQNFLGHLIRAGLEPHHHVLDIGCGSGRIAIPLTEYLTGGYEGFDVAADRIHWCQETITPHHPDFRFRHVPVRNSAYQEALEYKGKIRNTTRWGIGSIKRLARRSESGFVKWQRPAGFTFPYPDDAFDFALAISLFTHLVPEGAKRYLSEARRVLKPGGTLFSTWFLLDDFSRVRVERGETHWLRHPYGDAMMVEDPKRPEVAIGFSQEWVEEAMSDANLEPSQALYGSWAGRPDPVDYQDIVVSQAV
jgi:SAM-dependent methyltransferase